MGCPGRCWSPLRCPKPPGQGPVQAALGGPAGAEGWVRTSRGVSQSQLPLFDCLLCTWMSFPFQGRVALLHEMSPCRDRCPCLTKHHFAEKGPLSVTRQERGPIALVHRQGPLSHLSITPQGMTPIAHPSNATQTAQQRAATLAGPVLCQGSSALPTAFQGSSHDGEHPGRTWQGPVAAPSLALQQAGLGPGTAQEMGSGDPCPAWNSSAVSRVSQAQPSPGGGDTHPLAHTRGRSFGAAVPRHRREKEPSCQRGLQAPGAAGCGPAGQRAVMQDMCVGFGERLRWETGPCRDRGAVSCPKAQVPHEARHANAIQTTAGFEPNLPASGLICCNFD